MCTNISKLYSCRKIHLHNNMQHKTFLTFFKVNKTNFHSILKVAYLEKYTNP